MKKVYRIIGLMSGTSLDGLDVVDVTFYLQDKDWIFELNNSYLYDFHPELLVQLKKADEIPAENLIELSSKLGDFYAEKVNQFLQKKRIKKEEIDFIASHGQTIFHQPQKGFTLQIGNGPELAIKTQIPTVNDFRTKDVVLGGNGAPLIPVADFLLFSSFADSFLNLGGFANLSYKEKDKVLSFDICPANIILNHLTQQLGFDYDKNGNIGKKGEIERNLLEKLNNVSFYEQNPPKSLGWEWVKKEILPLLNKEIVLENQIRTLYEHIANQLSFVLNNISATSVLVTGGGAKNKFLIELLQQQTTKKIILPADEIIEFKEAIGFAFLGLLRWRNEINVWASVTGAKKDSCSGQIIFPF